MIEQIISFRGGRISFFDEEDKMSIVIVRSKGGRIETSYFLISDFMDRIFPPNATDQPAGALPAGQAR